MSLLKYSLTWFSSVKGVFRLFQPFSTVSRIWDSWRPVLLQDEGSVWYFSLFHILCHQVPSLDEQQAYIFPSLPFVTHALIIEALLVFDILHQIQLCLGFSVTNFVPGCSDTVSMFLRLSSTLCMLSYFCAWFHLGPIRSSMQASWHFWNCWDGPLLILEDIDDPFNIILLS